MKKKDEQRQYSVDIKVYERASLFEVPYFLPLEMIGALSNLKPGYYPNLIMNCTEQQFKEFQDWISKHGSILKVIGHTCIAY